MCPIRTTRDWKLTKTPSGRKKNPLTLVAGGQIGVAYLARLNSPNGRQKQAEVPCPLEHLACRQSCR